MELRKRKPNRLLDYDYGEIGCYFVTLCTQNRLRLFRMERSHGGGGMGNPTAAPNRILHQWLGEIPNKFPNMRIDKFVVMPDHIHLILDIRERCAGAALADAMGYFKTMTTNAYIRGVKQGVLPPFHKKLWQKSYYDHIIRSQADYNEAWEYIDNNPARWIETHS